MKQNYVLNSARINSINELNSVNLSFEDVYAHYGTGRSITHNSGREKTYSYRHGIGTNVGDIEVSVWCEIVKRLIVRANEQELFRNVKHWTKDHCPFYRDATELEIEALKLHALRIFDDPDWVDYVAFNSKYRPYLLYEEGRAEPV